MCIYIFFLNFYSFINLLSFKSLSLNRKHVAFKAQILPQTLGTLDSVFIPPPPETSLRTCGGGHTRIHCLLFLRDKCVLLISLFTSK